MKVVKIDVASKADKALWSSPKKSMRILNEFECRNFNVRSIDFGTWRQRMLYILSYFYIIFYIYITCHKYIIFTLNSRRNKFDSTQDWKTWFTMLLFCNSIKYSDSVNLYYYFKFEIRNQKSIKWFRNWKKFSFSEENTIKSSAEKSCLIERIDEFDNKISKVYF